MSTLRFLIIGDLHGDIPKIHVDLKTIDAIIAPGDFCSDEIRPYIMKLMKQNKDPNNLEDVIPKSREHYDKLSLKNGRKILEKINALGKPTFVVPGNWDHTPYEDGRVSNKENGWLKLIEGLNNIHDVEFMSKKFKGITFIGHGSTSAPEPKEKLPPEAFPDAEEFFEYVERWKFFDKVQHQLNSLFEKAKTPVILITHNVPYNTTLDKIDSPGSYAHGKHYGSRIARELIDKYQPLLCVGGHIHEGHGKAKLKNTLCLNAGFGGDVNTIVEIKDGKISKIEQLGKNKHND